MGHYKIGCYARPTHGLASLKHLWTSDTHLHSLDFRSCSSPCHQPLAIPSSAVMCCSVPGVILEGEATNFLRDIIWACRRCEREGGREGGRGPFCTATLRWRRPRPRPRPVHVSGAHGGANYTGISRFASPPPQIKRSLNTQSCGKHGFRKQHRDNAMCMHWLFPRPR